MNYLKVYIKWAKFCSFPPFDPEFRKNVFSASFHLAFFLLYFLI